MEKAWARGEEVVMVWGHGVLEEGGWGVGDRPEVGQLCGSGRGGLGGVQRVGCG